MLSKKAFTIILASCILWFYYTSVNREQSFQPATSLRSSSVDYISLHYTAPPAVSSATNEQQQSTTTCQYICNDISTSEQQHSRIEKDYPSLETIISILTAEQQNRTTTHSPKNNSTYITKLAKSYELVYALIAKFYQHDIPILLTFGSHIGARRHHGIIPFGEKDVDFSIFSLDGEKVKSIIQEVLNTQSSWSNLNITEAEFGYQIGSQSMIQEHDFSHYIDFWLIDDNYNNEHKIKCIGHQLLEPLPTGGRLANTGCEYWYIEYHGKQPPIYTYSDYFPPLYQIFGTHKVPIPQTSLEIETFQYGNEKDWNVTCGGYRTWNGEQWVGVPKEKRRCYSLYDMHPFVFKTGDCTEELRIGNDVMHTSSLCI